MIPVTLNGVPGSFVHSMYLDDHGPIAGGREIWGFPKKVLYFEKGGTLKRVVWVSLKRAALNFEDGGVVFA